MSQQRVSATSPHAGEEKCDGPEVIERRALDQATGKICPNLVDCRIPAKLLAFFLLDSTVFISIFIQ